MSEPNRRLPIHTFVSGSRVVPHIRFRYRFKRIYASYTEEQLDELLARPDVVAAQLRGEMKAPIVVPKSNMYRMQLTRDLEPEDMIGVVYASWHRITGEVRYLSLGG